MKIRNIVAAAGLVIAALGTSGAAQAQPYHDDGPRHDMHRGPYYNGHGHGWNNGRHWYGGRHYRPVRHCWTEWRHHHRIRVCR